LEIEDWISFTITGLITAGLFFLYIILGALIGTIMGWIISLTPLGSLVEEGFNVFGFHATGKLPHIGAMLGFLSGFLKGLIEVKAEVKSD